MTSRGGSNVGQDASRSMNTCLFAYIGTGRRESNPTIHARPVPVALKPLCDPLPRE